jgi:hypothetical protein
MQVVESQVGPNGLLEARRTDAPTVIIALHAAVREVGDDSAAEGQQHI